MVNCVSILCFPYFLGNFYNDLAGVQFAILNSTGRQSKTHLRDACPDGRHPAGVSGGPINITVHIYDTPFFTQRESTGCSTMLNPMRSFELIITNCYSREECGTKFKLFLEEPASEQYPSCPSLGHTTFGSFKSSLGYFVRCRKHRVEIGVIVIGIASL